MATWIVRLVLAVLTFEAGVCAVFLADEWPLLRHQEQTLFTAALSVARPGERFVLDPVPADQRVRHARPLQAGTMQTYFHVPITKDSLYQLGASEFQVSELSPTTWKIVLTHMREAGCEVVAIAPPLTWASEGLEFLDLGSLDSALALYETAVLTVDLQRVKDAEPIPDYLRPSAIPLDNVRGEVGRLVRVNRVIDPPSASPAPNIQFSFRLQESVEGATPAFVRWDDHLIPSFPLAIAMAQNSVKPADVSIELGRHIRLGDGPLVPINEIGEIEMALVTRPELVQVELELLSVPSGIEAARRKCPDEIPRCVIFPDATPSRPDASPSPDRLQRIVNSFDVLPRPGEVEPHQRLPIWAELLFLFVIAVVASLVLSCRGGLRILGLGLHLVLVAVLLGALLVEYQRWMPLAPIAIACAVGLLLSFRLARHLPNRQPVPADT